MSLLNVTWECGIGVSNPFALELLVERLGWLWPRWLSYVTEKQTWITNSFAYLLF